MFADYYQHRHFDLGKFTPQIEFGELRTVTVSRPDRLRVQGARSDGTKTLTVFNGKEILLIDETTNVYATAPQPGGLDDAIVQYIKKEYSLMLGERTAEEVKMEIGTAFPIPDVPDAEIRGRDLVTGLPKTILVSATPSGKPGKFGSGSPSISPDGRYVVFGSGSPDLVPGSPDFFNTYLRDLKTGKTTLESRTSTGAPIQESTLEGAMSNGGFAFVSLSTTVMPDGGDQRNAQVYFRSL